MPRSSLLTLTHATRRLPSRQKWDQRYATLNPNERREPIPFVAACLPQLPTHGWALDVAAGVGRHSLALAQHGLQVVAVDISGQGLRRVQQRASEAGLTGRIQGIVADLERPWLPLHTFDVVLITYFLHRPLLPLVKQRLRPGGWLVYETFTKAQTDMPYHHQSSHPGFYLDANELRRMFSDFDILFYAEGSHERRMTAQLLAQKPQQR